MIDGRARAGYAFALIVCLLVLGSATYFYIRPDGGLRVCTDADYGKDIWAFGHPQGCRLDEAAFDLWLETKRLNDKTFTTQAQR
jgi:hypothetical protein